MLEHVLRHIKNWFTVSAHSGTFVVENGSIVLPFLMDGQYFRIEGSVFNDGLHRYPAYGLTGETFVGKVYALAIPNAVIEISHEIEEWNKANEARLLSPYQSESFGGYSYTLKGGNDTKNVVTWQKAFAHKLSEWRKI